MIVDLRGKPEQKQWSSSSQKRSLVWKCLCKKLPVTYEWKPFRRRSTDRNTLEKGSHESFTSKFHTWFPCRDRNHSRVSYHLQSEKQQEVESRRPEKPGHVDKKENWSWNWKNKQRNNQDETNVRESQTRITWPELDSSLEKEIITSFQLSSYHKVHQKVITEEAKKKEMFKLWGIFNPIPLMYFYDSCRVPRFGVSEAQLSHYNHFVHELMPNERNTLYSLVESTCPLRSKKF